METKIIKELRKGKGPKGKIISKSQLAKESTVSRNKITRMELGQKVNFTDVVKVLETLGYGLALTVKS